MITVYALCGGYLDMDRTEMVPDGSPSARWTVPVPSFLVVHSRGRLLFDTGVHPAATADPVGRLGEARSRRIGVRSREGDDVISQLGRLGLGAGDVTHVANSHLHFDHCGGNEFFPHAAVLVQKREMDAARDPAVTGSGRYNPSALDFDHPLPYQLVDGEHDVFGDGSVLLIPTYGHTPGHQSLLVRSGKDARVVFSADACYTRENMDRDILPRILWDPVEMARSLDALRSLRDRQGVTVFYGHDPGQWESSARAPAALV
ncbi:MAG TPA: N-acyl homoserine lactonase family protein [Candidatus Binatia bacterium]|nr:N-acyl homoserine lactonase family protein [Candidatus Binatia bacterium]